jgi:Flp pilus assembly protein TadG
MAGFLKKLIRDDRGAALVEAAVTFPVLIILGAGVFEFSNAFYAHQEITTGVRDAARYLARAELSNPAPTTCDAAIAAAAAGAQNLAVYGNISGGGNARVQGWTTGMVTVTSTDVANAPVGGIPPYRGPNPLCIVNVAAAVPYPQFGLLTYLGVAVPTFNLAHSERWIGG